jgi:hypothetical protein
MKEEVSLIVGYGAVLGQRIMRLAALYSVMDQRESGLSRVERSTFHVGMRCSGGKGRATVDDSSLYATLVPVCRVGGYSQFNDDSLTHELTRLRNPG